MKLIDADEIIKHVYESKEYSETVIEWLVPYAKMGKEKRMTDDEMHEYLNGEPTIKGIVEEMKTWWSNEGTDDILQMCFDKILELAERENNETD